LPLMAKPYWYKQHEGFVHNGSRLHREELKTINAQLAGHWEAPLKSRPRRRVPVLPVVLPEQFVPVKSPEPSELAEHIRDTRLDVLQTLGELMLDADAA
jgi:hypothetical protein